MPIRFAANLTTMFQEGSGLNLLERYAAAKALGFKAVEIGFPYEFSKEAVAEAKNKSGLQQVLLNAYPGKTLGTAALVGKESEFMESLKKSVEYCRATETKLLHLMSGKTENETGSYEVLESNLRSAIPLLKEAGVVGLIEPINNYWVPNYFLNDYDMGAKIVSDINSPNIRLMLDVFHLQYLKGDLTNSIKKFLPLTGHIQIAQVPKRGEPDSEGEINYSYVLKEIERNGYEGWIGLEYIPTKKNDDVSWIQSMNYSL